MKFMTIIIKNYEDIYLLVQIEWSIYSKKISFMGSNKKIANKQSNAIN